VSVVRKGDYWLVSVTIPANSPALSRHIAEITYADLQGIKTTTTKLQLPYKAVIRDIIVSAAPTPDVYVIIDKNNGKKQIASVPLSQLVIQAGRPRLPPFGTDRLGRKVEVAVYPFEILTIYVVPLADVGASAVTVTFQLYVEYE
jgi:hypothetical protein